MSASRCPTINRRYLWRISFLEEEEEEEEVFLGAKKTWHAATYNRTACKLVSRMKKGQIVESSRESANFTPFFTILLSLPDSNTNALCCVFRKDPSPSFSDFFLFSFTSRPWDCRLCFLLIGKRSPDHESCLCLCPLVCCALSSLVF